MVAARQVDYVASRVDSEVVAVCHHQRCQERQVRLQGERFAPGWSFCGPRRPLGGPERREPREQAERSSPWYVYALSIGTDTL